MTDFSDCDAAADMAHAEWVMDKAVEKAVLRMQEACAEIAEWAKDPAEEIRALNIKKLLEGGDA